MRTVPDTPRIDDYGASVGVSTNSIVEQGKPESVDRLYGDPICV